VRRSREQAGWEQSAPLIRCSGHVDNGCCPARLMAGAGSWLLACSPLPCCFARHTLAACLLAAMCVHPLCALAGSFGLGVVQARTAMCEQAVLQNARLVPASRHLGGYCGARQRAACAHF